MKTGSFIMLMSVLLIIVFGGIFSIVTIENYKSELEMYKAIPCDDYKDIFLKEKILHKETFDKCQRQISFLDGIITKHKIEQNTMTIYLNKILKDNQEMEIALKQYVQMYSAVKQDFQHYFQ